MQQGPRVEQNDSRVEQNESEVKKDEIRVKKITITATEKVEDNTKYIDATYQAVAKIVDKKAIVRSIKCDENIELQELKEIAREKTKITQTSKGPEVEKGEVDVKPFVQNMVKWNGKDAKAAIHPELLKAHPEITHILFEDELPLGITDEEIKQLDVDHLPPGMHAVPAREMTQEEQDEVEAAVLTNVNYARQSYIQKKLAEMQNAKQNIPQAKNAHPSETSSTTPSVDGSERGRKRRLGNDLQTTAENMEVVASKRFQKTIKEEEAQFYISIIDKLRLGGENRKKIEAFKYQRNLLAEVRRYLLEQFANKQDALKMRNAKDEEVIEHLENMNKLLFEGKQITNNQMDTNARILLEMKHLIGKMREAAKILDRPISTLDELTASLWDLHRALPSGLRLGDKEMAQIIAWNREHAGPLEGHKLGEILIKVAQTLSERVHSSLFRLFVYSYTIWLHLTDAVQFLYQKVLFWLLKGEREGEFPPRLTA